MVGFFIFSIGLAGFGIFENVAPMFIVSMFVVSIGEILVFSNSYLLIDKIGPQHLKGSYFGITELCNLGFVLGPSLGGIILQQSSGQIMFPILASLSIVSIGSFILGNRLHQRKLAPAQI